MNKFKEWFVRTFSDTDTNGKTSFSSLYLLIFWPLFGLAFQLLEKFPISDKFYSVHCGMDDIIPFNELFVIPYMFWFVYMIGMHFYTFFYERDVFRKYVKFIIYTYTTTLIIYILFPTCQNLRPETFERTNILTNFMGYFYKFDTNTNVCPSMHVIGAIAVAVAAHNTKLFSTTAWKLLYDITTIFICLSTVFLKQHSVIDVVVAIPICIGGYVFAYKKVVILKNKERQKTKWKKKLQS